MLCHRPIQNRQNPQSPSKTMSGFSGGAETWRDRGSLMSGVYVFIYKWLGHRHLQLRSTLTFLYRLRKLPP